MNTLGGHKRHLQTSLGLDHPVSRGNKLHISLRHVPNCNVKYLLVGKMVIKFSLQDKENYKLLCTKYYSFCKNNNIYTHQKLR